MRPWFVDLKKKAQSTLKDFPIDEWVTPEEMTLETDPRGLSRRSAEFMSAASPARVLALILELEASYAAQYDIFVPENHE